MELKYFIEKDFNQALKDFFKDLNISLNKTIVRPIQPQNIFQESFDKNNKYHQSLDEIHFMGFVDKDSFKNEVQEISDLNDIKSKYESMVILGVVLKQNTPTSKTFLSELTRIINKKFQQRFSLYNFPIVIIFKYGESISFANCERVNYQQSGHLGEKLGKVSILKDININKTHSGHLRILESLRIKRDGKGAINTFEELYKYWQEVFNVSVLNKKFYQELSNWYFWAIKQVKFPNEPTLAEAHEKKVVIEDLIQEHKAKNVIRMLTRLLFVWFIKEKNLVPESLFDLKFLQDEFLNEISPYHEDGLFQEANKDSIYYKAILQNLFFATLNCPIKPTEENDDRVRGFRKLDNYGQHRGADFLMRYEKHFKNPQKFLEMVNNVVPFLNGGLFECLDDKENKKYIDGFSDNLPKTENLLVPDYLFFGRDENVDLSTEYGVKNRGTQEASVKGLINILKSYKFTVDENTPLEEEIALDPELLGKVFENLLASYNPETKTTARKQTGSFYTPREIVNYMVDESLIAYLKEKVIREEVKSEKSEEIENELRKLFSYNQEEVNFSEEEKDLIIKELNNCKILDPACGSGAFPMGILHKMVHVLKKIDPNNTKWEKEQKEKTIGDKIKELEEDKKSIENLKDEEVRHKAVEAVEEKLKEIEEVFRSENNFDDYSRKLYLIENCIYGVDIQPIATQISKLRFFISLIVDQVPDKEKDNFGIRPLPNLETKFVAANTLIGIEKPKNQMDIFSLDDKLNKLEKDLKDNRHKLFSAKSPATKKRLREKDKDLREEMSQLLIKTGITTETAKKLASWDPYNQNVSSEFFDMEWMFGIHDGFDVVIGNPPYVFTRDVDFSDSFKKYIDKEYFRNTTKEKKSKSNQSGKINLFGLFILKSLKLQRNNAVMTYIIPNNILRTTTYDLIRKSILENSFISTIVDLGSNVFSEVTASTIILSLIKNTNYSKEKLSKIITNIENNSLLNYKLDYLNQNQFLNNISYAFNIFLNEKETLISEKISRNKKELGYFCVDIIEGIVAHKHLILSESLDENYVPLLEGKDIKRYYIQDVKNYLKWDKKEIHRTRPEYLWKEEKKIIMQRISGGKRPLVSSIDNNKFKTFASINNIVLKEKFSSFYEFFVSLLNSRLINWYYANNFSNNSNLTVNISKTFLEKLPIKEISLDAQQPFIDLVEQIMEKKKIGEDTQELEDKIDLMVYKLYELTYNEVKIVDPEFKISEEEYNKL